MPLETATYFTDLVTSNPAHTDGLNQGDAHLRLIKSTLQASFKNWTSTSGVGSVAYLSATQAQLDNAVNLLTGVSGAAAFPAGTVGAPSIAFTGDPDSGIYKLAEDTVSISVNGGAVQFEVGTGGAFLSAGGLSVGSNYNNGLFCVPGLIGMYQGTSAPTGWAFLNGQTVSAASNPVLASIYGSSGGNVTLPDWRCYAPVGVDNMGGAGTTNRINNWGSAPATLGGLFGESAHTLVVGEIPQITPAGTISGTIGGSQSFTSVIFQAGSNAAPAAGSNLNLTGNTTINGSNFSFSGSFSGTPFGGGGAHNNVQLSVATGFIIKLG